MEQKIINALNGKNFRSRVIWFLKTFIFLISIKKREAVDVDNFFSIISRI